MKTCLHKNLYNDVYSDSINSLIITETWKQLRWPPLNKWLYTVKTIYLFIQILQKVFSGTENKMSYPRHEKTWGGFKCILLSERRLSEKAIYFRKGKTMAMVQKEICGSWSKGSTDRA